MVQPNKIYITFTNSKVLVSILIQYLYNKGLSNNAIGKRNTKGANVKISSKILSYKSP